MNLVFRTRFEIRIEFEMALFISDVFLNDKPTFYFEVFHKTKIPQWNANKIFLHQVQVEYV